MLKQILEILIGNEPDVAIQLDAIDPDWRAKLDDELVQLDRQVASGNGNNGNGNNGNGNGNLTTMSFSHPLEAELVAGEPINSVARKYPVADVRKCAEALGIDLKKENGRNKTEKELLAEIKSKLLANG